MSDREFVVNVTANISDNAEFLAELARQLRDTPRLGGDADQPEGSRYIVISDTLANELSRKIFKLIEVSDPK
jgi:hypothetical protein